MTHKDIYTKFMIEYDKANVTSSYPSLTEYEVATLLDKAYLALIAQKLTGNNQRRMPFEGDNKAIADIAPLITHKELELFTDGHEPAINIIQYKLPKDFLYYVSSALNQKMIPTNPNGDRLLEPEVYDPADIKFEAEDDDSWVKHSDVYYGVNSSFDTTSDSTKTTEAVKKGLPYDGDQFRLVPMKIATHQIAEKFFNTPYNMPWVKIPVTYAEGDSMFVVYDPINKPMLNSTVHLSYIRKPLSFVQSLTEIDNRDQTPTDPEPTEQDNPTNPDPTPHTPEQNPDNDEQGNQGGSQTPTDDTDTQMYDASAVFNFDNPESLNPSITRSPYEGGGVECENIQFTSSDGKVSITFDNSNVTPKSNARIVTNNEANLKIPYLTVDRGHVISIHVDGENAKLRYVRIPAGDIIGGITFDHTYPTETVGTFSLTQNNEYNSWDNTEPLQNITTLYLKNNSPIPPMIHQIEVGYTTADAPQQQEPSQPEQPIDNPSSDTVYDFTQVNTIYMPGFKSEYSDVNEIYSNPLVLASTNTPMYASNKNVELLDYNENVVMFRGPLQAVNSDQYEGAYEYVLKVVPGSIENQLVQGKTYVWVLREGTIGDQDFIQGKGGHANPYGYWFVRPANN